MNGMHVPKAINEESKETSRKKNVDETQRKLERMIREQKEKQMFALTPEERRKAIEDSKGLTEYYQKFSKANGVPYYPWRCSITMDERSVNRFNDLGLNTEEYVARTSVARDNVVVEETKPIEEPTIIIENFKDAPPGFTHNPNYEPFINVDDKGDITTYIFKNENTDYDYSQYFKNEVNAPKNFALTLSHGEESVIHINEHHKEHWEQHTPNFIPLVIEAIKNPEVVYVEEKNKNKFNKNTGEREFNVTVVNFLSENYMMITILALNNEENRVVTSYPKENSKLKKHTKDAIERYKNKNKKE